jgi:hypothetical protein
LLFCKRDFTGCAAIVGGQADGRELIGVRAGAAGWTQAPELLFSHRLPEAEWAEGIGKELIAECLGQTPELYGWGNAEQVIGSANGEKGECEDLCGLGIEKLGGSSQLSAACAPWCSGSPLRDQLSPATWSGARRAKKSLTAELGDDRLAGSLACGLGNQLPDQGRIAPKTTAAGES